VSAGAPSGPGVVVVGASLAGLRAAEEVRARGYAGPVTMVGEEPHRPYDRPPLSKQVLAGAWEPDRIALAVAHAAGIDGLGLDWRLGTRATGLDVDRRRVLLAGGSSLAYDGLVVATGATPRTLPGTDHLTGVHTLRTLDDCLDVYKLLAAGPERVVVVGGGFIGAEVAATARGHGIDVTLVEALPVPLGRVLGDEIGAVMADLHRDHGVDVRLGVGVDGLDARPGAEAGADGRAPVGRVRLADGSAVDADLVVVGIGVAPATGWLEGSGLTLDNGVVCDETTLAAPGVVAAGDVARWPSRRFGDLIRVEHWDNAITMGAHAGRRLLAELGQPGGEVEAYDPVPWFWSDQYDRKVQLAGRSVDADEVRVVDGSTEERRFVALYRKGDRLAAVLAMNRPRPMLAYRQLIERGGSWDEALSVTER
jgi:3-phenylpropionate/trans-cinnamate dioxygenase ferredoxin reductase subunit